MSWFPPVVSTDTCVERGLLPAKGVENPAPPSLITLVVCLGTHPIRNWIGNIAPHLSFANIGGHGATVFSVVFNLSSGYFLKLFRLAILPLTWFFGYKE